MQRIWHVLDSNPIAKKNRMSKLIEMPRKKQIVFSFIILGLLLSACQNKNNKDQEKAKYVFYFIADGLGLSHISQTESYLAETTDLDYSRPRLNMTQMEHVGLTRTHAQNRLITGSAAAGTALATGHKTSINTVGMAADKQRPIQSIAISAKKAGMKVGIMSSVMINHATPAAFYAHVPERNHYYEIGLQIGETNIDFFGGGGLADMNGKESDKESLTDILSGKGITIINDNAVFLNLKNIDNQLIYTHSRLDATQAMPFALDKNENDLSLSQIVSKSIELLDNPHGFFIMVEGGKIDWANHANDAAASIQDIIDFDNAIGAALDFYKKNPENTLIVVCSDHETGGLSLGNKKHSYESKPSLLKHQKVSLDSLSLVLINYQKVKKARSNFSEVQDTLKKYLGLGIDEMQLSKEELKTLREQFEKGLGKNQIDDKNGTHKLAVVAMRILNNKAGIAWGTGSHTSQPTLVFATGAGSYLFQGYYDNTDLARKIAKVMQINHKFTIQE
jgi:alkaline phosphatase